jgi:hypothetical protein
MVAPRWVGIIGIAVTVFAVAWAGAPGTFRGTVVEPLLRNRSDDGWVYVEGRNQMVRRVEVHKAKVLFADDVPTAQRRGTPEAWLIAGTEVRVTAVQGADGEWHATRIEILKLPQESDPEPGMWQSALSTRTSGLTNS